MEGFWRVFGRVFGWVFSWVNGWVNGGVNPTIILFFFYRIQRGYSLNGRAAILQIANLGSSPNISTGNCIEIFLLSKLDKLNLVERNSEEV